MKTYSRPSQTRSNNTGRSDNKRQDAPREQSRPSVRGNPREMHQKYLNMAREAIQSGDIVEAEQHYQYAEHYYRVFSDRSTFSSPAPQPASSYSPARAPDSPNRELPRSAPLVNQPVVTANGSDTTPDTKFPMDTPLPH